MVGEVEGHPQHTLIVLPLFFVFFSPFFSFSASFSPLRPLSVRFSVHHILTSSLSFTYLLSLLVDPATTTTFINIHSLSHTLPYLLHLKGLVPIGYASLRLRHFGHVASHTGVAPCLRFAPITALRDGGDEGGVAIP